MNIDGCRIEADEALRAGAGGTWDKMHDHEGRGRDGEASENRRYAENGGTNFAMTPGPRGGDPAGRWPANLIHDGSDEALAVFPFAPGAIAQVTGKESSDKTQNTFGEFAGRAPSDQRDGGGSAARFFYCAKPDRAERDMGCKGLPLRAGGMTSETSETSGQHITRRDGGAPGPVHNDHPTVKPIELMRYLCKLVTPPQGVVLDCFLGSGTTGIAALREHFQFIGIEREAEYVEIARARIMADAPMFTTVDVDRAAA